MTASFDLGQAKYFIFDIAKTAVKRANIVTALFIRIESDDGGTDMRTSTHRSLMWLTRFSGAL